MLSRWITFILALLGLCTSLTACQSLLPQISSFVQGAADSTQAVTSTPFQVQTPTLLPRLPLTPSLVPTPTLMPSPTPLLCATGAGKIEPLEVQFTASGSPFDFQVYTPPCFNQENSARYPVLYMIHGQTYHDDQWVRLGIGPAADALIHAHQAPPFLIVMPEEPDTYADIYIESFGRDVTDRLVPWIDAHYPTCAGRSCRAIGGLSRGGAWALRLGFTHPELFGAIGLHSTPPFNTDPGLFPTWVRDIPADQMPRVYMDIGRSDPFLSMASAFEAQLVRYNVPHEWYLFNGTHEEAYWSAHVSEYLEWYTRTWKDMAQ